LNAARAFTEALIARADDEYYNSNNNDEVSGL
jgi:hypothetical protein